MVVNALGSFLIGLVMTLLEARGALDSTLRVALAAGVLGGFTTYSSFNYQTLEFLRQKAWMAGGLNLLATVSLCLAAGLLDELHLHIVPIALGGGIRLLDGFGPDNLSLEPNRVVTSPAVTHIRYRVSTQ